MSGQIDHHEQQVAHLFRLGRRVAVGHGLQHFVQFFAQLVHHRQGFRPVEADLRRALLQLGRARQRRQRHRHVVEQGQLHRFGGLGRAFLGLQLFPALLDCRFLQLAHVRRAVQVAIGEHVWMAAHQLVGNAVDHLVETEALLFAGQLRVVDDLEQQVAELLAQVGEVATLDGVGDFIGFFQGVGDDARVVLLQVPRAAMLRIAQARHQVQQVVELIHPWHPRRDRAAPR
ncbi:hypothetical protein D3C81_1199860 [compost metagenome]